jgi:hypothetical protein
MGRLLAAAIICAALAYAQAARDRIAIEDLIHSLNTAQPVSALFTAGAESDLDRLQAIQREMKIAVNRTSGVAPPAFVMAEVRFLGPDVAMVNAAEVQLGGESPRKIPVLFVLRRDTAGWKIAALRLLDPGTRRMPETGFFRP